MNRAEGPKPVDAKPTPRTGASVAPTRAVRDRSAPRTAPSASDDPAPSASAPDPMNLPLMPPMATSAESQPEMEPEDDAAVQPMPMPESSRGDAARGRGGTRLDRPSPDAGRPVVR